MLRKTVALMVLCLCAVHTSSFANEKPSYWLDGKWPHEKSTLPKHDGAVYGRLKNGFRFIIQHNENHKGRVAVQLLVQAGSLMERDNERGVAHFLEHLAFNGTKNFPAGKLIPFLQSNGMAFGRDANAYTSMKETVYELNILDNENAMNDALVFMRDVADGILIADKEVEAERGVIISEKNSRDSERFRMSLRLRQLFFPGTEFVHPTIGTEEVINTVSAQTIKAFYDAWYRPEYMILLVVGNVNTKELETVIEQKFASLASRAEKRHIFPFKQANLQGVIPYYDKYESQSTTVQIRSLLPLTWMHDSLEVQSHLLYASMAHTIISNRLRNMIAEGEAAFLKGGARYSESFNLFPSSDLFAQVEAKNWKKSFKQLENVLLVALKYGFLPEEVEEVQQSYLRTYEKRAEFSKQEANEDITKNMIGSFMSDRVYQSWEQTLAMYGNLIPKATPQTLHQAFQKLWEHDVRFVSVLGNAHIKGDAKASIATLWEKGLQEKLQPLQAKTALKYPYLELPQKLGTVVAEKKIPIKNLPLKLHEITFANGLILRLLNTPFDKGRVSVQVGLGGGSDAIKDADYITAMVSMATEKQSGFGKLTLADVRRLSTTQGVAVSGKLMPEYLDMSSAGESENLEKMLIALWTMHKDPVITGEDRKRAMRTYALADKERTKDLAQVLATAQRKLFWGESLRNTPITFADAKKVNLATQQDILKKLYAGGAPVINMVGDVQSKDAIAFVGKTFGSDSVTYEKLPQAPYAIKYAFAKDVNNPEHIVFDSKLNQASVRVAYYRPLLDVLDRKTLLKRRLVASLLSDLMRKVIREKISASYSPRVLFPINDASGYAMYLIIIGTQPETMELLQKELGTILTEFATNGVSEKDLERIKKITVSGWEQNSQKNKIYTQLLASMIREDRPYLDWYGELPSMVKSISLEEINAEIKEAFTDDNKAVLTGITEDKTAQK